jgi:hypothetical protein
MSTYSTDTELPDIQDRNRADIFVSSSYVDRLVRVDINTARDDEPAYYATPDMARQIAAALLRQADLAER